MSLWESQDAALATGGKNTLSWSANGVSIDSRTIQKGDLFIALKAKRDGHKFVNKAFENGAAAALVDHVPFWSFHLVVKKVKFLSFWRLLSRFEVAWN